MPFAHDQPDNAARLRRLGVAHELRRLRDMPQALDALIRSASVEVACRAAAARIAGTRSLQIAADAVENEAAEAAA
jgi:UDP:flavonoid glycosyltransferase YjiC (YdhE family)